MPTSIMPITAIPTASGNISGQFTSASTTVRLSAALTSGGEDTLQLIRKTGTGYWEAVPNANIELQRTSQDMTGGAAALDVYVGNSGDVLHVVSRSGRAISAGSVTLEDITPATSIALPSITGDTIALLAATQSLSNKTLVAPVVSTGLTATGSASNDFSGSTGAFKTSTGAVTIGGGAAAITATSSGAAITLTAGAASTWSTSAGALAVSGFAGINLQVNGTTVADVGATNAAKLTLAANKSLSGAAGTGGLDCGSMTGDTALPTGALSWAGASGKAVSVVATSAAITITAAAASTWSTSSGALTLTSAAAATWSTAAGALTVSGAGGINLQRNAATLVDVGVTGASAVTLAAGISLSGAAGAGGLSCGSMTGDTALPTGALSWAGASGKAVSIVATGAAITLTAAAASTWKTSSGALTVDSAAALNLGTSDSTSQSIGKSGTIATFNGKIAFGASAQTIADPGNAGAIPVTTNGYCALTTAGAETRTLAIPTFTGQRLTITLDTDGGDAVVTVASAFNAAGNTVITLNDAGDSVDLVARTVGGTRAWLLVVNNGCTLS